MVLINPEISPQNDLSKVFLEIPYKFFSELNYSVHFVKNSETIVRRAFQEF